MPDTMEHSFAGPDSEAEWNGFYRRERLPPSR